MILRGIHKAILTVLAGVIIAPAMAEPVPLLTDSSLEQLGVQRYWHTKLQLSSGESVSRVTLLDDNAYVLTDRNRVYAVHAPTGIIRWADVVADEGQTIRGPTHGEDFVFFTTPGTVRVFNRRTGEPAVEPRSLRGVILQASQTVATISIGELHGVRRDQVFEVRQRMADGELETAPIAHLKITSVDRRTAKGRLTRLSSRVRTKVGDGVGVDVVLPLYEVKLPFAASSAANAAKVKVGLEDEIWLFVGAANQRLYSISLLTGFKNWQLLTPKTLTTTPAIRNGILYLGGQDGRIASLELANREKQWAYNTDGPIFADIALDEARVFVASSDRSLYCLQRETDDEAGRLVWRERFDEQLLDAPVVANGKVYQIVPSKGLHVLDARSGKRLWHHPTGDRYLVHMDEFDFLFAGGNGQKLLRVSPLDGKVKTSVDASAVAFAAADQQDSSIVLASKDGQLSCLRSKKAPRMTPARLAEVLRNERKMQRMAEMTAAAEAKKRKAKLLAAVKELERRAPLFEDDWLASRSTAKPVGGRGLISVDGSGTKPDASLGRLDDTEEEKEFDEDEDELDEDEEELDEDEADLDDEEEEADEEDEAEEDLDDEEDDDEDLDDDEEDDEEDLDDEEDDDEEEEEE